jgi:hypothetical protein
MRMNITNSLLVCASILFLFACANVTVCQVTPRKRPVEGRIIDQTPKPQTPNPRTEAGAQTNQPRVQVLPPDDVEPLPPQTIVVRIRYKEELGYMQEHNNYGDKAPFSCTAFMVTTTVVVRSSGPFGPDRNIGTSREVGNMKQGDGYYSCWFEIADLPFREPVTIFGRMGVPLHPGRDMSTERWLGGSQPQPPPGYQRTVIGSRGITLTARQPSAIVDLEMVYRPIATSP